MRFATSCFVVMAISALAGFEATSAQKPASKPPSTTITVPEMHCVNCAKKMAGEISKVAGAGQVFANLEATTITILHKENATPSPKALWEAVERAGFDPSRLQNSSGVFTRKPKA